MTIDITPIKVLMLDVDGVFRILPSRRKGGIIVGAQCVAAINRLIKQTGLKLVLSSTWRSGGLARAQDRLFEWGIQHRIYGITHDFSDLYAGVSGLWLSVSRTTEISTWLRDCPVPVSNLLILDDDPIEEPLTPYHLQTTFERGFTKDDFDRALQILRRPYNLPLSTVLATVPVPIFPPLPPI